MNETDAPILARLAPAPLGDMTAAPAEIPVFPAGTHTINATQNGRPITRKVTVGPEAATALQASLDAFFAAKQRPYFDFDHDDTKASAWPNGFRWEDGRSGKAPGVYAAVEWSGSGSAAVLGKDYRSFSPAFTVDGADPARVTGAPLNMGGLVNAPAFKAQAPIWAKNTASAATPKNPKSNMTPEEQQAAAAAEQKKQADAAAAAKVETDAIKAKDTQLAALTSERDALKAKDHERRKADAKTAVDSAVKRGALPAKDTAIHAKWTGLIEADPQNAELLAALPGSSLLTTITKPGGLIEAKDGLLLVLKGLSEERDPEKRGLIYAKDIAPLFAKNEGFSREFGVILAANSLSTLAGELVLQRSMSLLKLTFPVIGKVSNDFSSANANFNQTIRTRLRTVPTVTDYDPVAGYTTDDSTTTDVPITINNHKAVQISFNANELGSTSRDLFGEQVEGCHYALGKAIVDALYAVITAGNFANNTVQALNGFGRPTLRAMAKELYKLGVPGAGRFALLNPDYFEAVGDDPSIVSLAAFQKPEVITGYSLPPVAEFDLIQAVNLPTAANLTGFAAGPDALAIATRVPNDYTLALPGASNGVVTTVTNPDTGITLQLVMFVNHTLGASFWRAAVMFGVAKGNPNSGRRLVSA